MEVVILRAKLRQYCDIFSRQDTSCGHQFENGEKKAVFYDRSIRCLAFPDYVNPRSRCYETQITRGVRTPIAIKTIASKITFDKFCGVLLNPKRSQLSPLSQNSRIKHSFVIHKRIEGQTRSDQSTERKLGNNGSIVLTDRSEFYFICEKIRRFVSRKLYSLQRREEVKIFLEIIVDGFFFSDSFAVVECE